VAWVPATVYAGYLGVLSFVQLRFAGEFSVVLAVFAGIGFVHLASVTTSVRRPVVFGGDGRGTATRPDVTIPGRRTTLNLVVIFVLVASAGIVQTPIKTSQLSIDGDAHDAAQWMETHAEEHDLSNSERYVFSEWGRNRMYNYFVRGQSRFYGYALENYDPFVTSTDPEEWYQTLADRVGYVVLTGNTNARPETIYTRLHEHYGGRSGRANGTGRFRATYLSDDRSVQVYRPVPGAWVAGRAPGEESTTVETTVDVSEETVPYARRTAVREDGWYAVRVAYPGTYTVGDATVDVSESAVETGGFGGEKRPRSAWSVTEGRGAVVFDRFGGHHGIGTNLSYESGVDGDALALNGDGAVTVPDHPQLNGSGGFTVAGWFKLQEDVDYLGQVSNPRIISKAPKDPYHQTKGYQIALSERRPTASLGNGTAAIRLAGKRVAGTGWHHVALTWNGSVATLFVDGKRVDEGIYRGAMDSSVPLVIGADGDHRHRFHGRIDEIQYRNASVDLDTVRSWSAVNGIGDGS
jgi:dolichyl-diphosphooligosaccharide--protein glycosyltransferase